MTQSGPHAIASSFISIEAAEHTWPAARRREIVKPDSAPSGKWPMKCWGGLTMSILERLSAATRDLSVGGQISSLLGRGSSSQAREIHTEPDHEVPFTVGVV